MPSIYALKPAFQRLLRPLVSKLADRGVRANHVTVSAALLSALVGVLIAASPESTGLLLMLPVVLPLRMALNAVDGMLAREHGQRSHLGAVLNELGDVLSDFSLYLPLALVAGFDARLIVPIVCLAIIAELTGILSKALGGTRRFDGPMGKSDRAFFFGATGLLVGIGVPTSGWLPVVLWVALGLQAWTILVRARRGLAELGEGGGKRAE